MSRITLYLSLLITFTGIFGIIFFNIVNGIIEKNNTQVIIATLCFTFIISLIDIRIIFESAIIKKKLNKIVIKLNSLKK